MNGGNLHRTAISVCALCLGAAAPAMAGSGIQIPEPTDVTLIAIALAGLIYGRRNGKRPPEE